MSVRYDKLPKGWGLPKRQQRVAPPKVKDPYKPDNVYIIDGKRYEGFNAKNPWKKE